MSYYEISVMQEIWMLLDFIAGNSTMSIKKLEVTDPWDGQKKLATVDILNRLSQIDRKLGEERQNDMSETCEQELSFLLLIRNALNTIVRPASALTIAYTGLVAGHRLKGDQENVRKSRWSLARAAFPQLAPWCHTAQTGTLPHPDFGSAPDFFRWSGILAKVALGKALLQNLQDLRTPTGRAVRGEGRAGGGPGKSRPLGGPQACADQRSAVIGIAPLRPSTFSMAEDDCCQTRRPDSRRSSTKRTKTTKGGV